MNTLEDFDLQILFREANRGAVHLRYHLGYPTSDQEDLAQDLLLDILRRLSRFDPERGALGAFAGVVMRNRCRSVAARARKSRHLQGHHLPLDSLVAGKEGRSLAEVLPETESIWNWTGQTQPDPDRTLAVNSVLGRLASEDLSLCIDLACESATDLIRAGRYSRSGLYRRISRLRRRFCAWGIVGSNV